MRAQAARSPGFALVAAVAVMALLVGVTGSVLALSMSSAQAARVSAARARALAAAEAGATLQVEEVRRGRGALALSGSFGSGAYVASAPAALANGCRAISCTGTADREHRTVEVYLVEARGVDARSFSPVRVQGGGLLTVRFQGAKGWRISGQDTPPPSLGGKGFDDLTLLGKGPLGMRARPGFSVQTALQKSLVAAQISSSEQAQLDGVERGASRNGADAIVVEPGAEIDLARVTAELRPGATVISSRTTQQQLGTWAQPRVVFLENGARLDSLQGAGILVITGDDIQIAGDLLWEGLVLQYSPKLLEMPLLVQGKVRIFGGLVIEDPSGVMVPYSVGDSHLIYSSQAIENAGALVGGTTLSVVGCRVIL